MKTSTSVKPKRKRSHRILVSFNDNEFATLNRKVAMTTYPREKFIREVLLGCEVVEKPPAEYADTLRQLRALGNLAHQLLLKAIQTGFIDTVMLQDVYDMAVEMDELFSSAFSPRRRRKR